MAETPKLNVTEQGRKPVRCAKFDPAANEDLPEQRGSCARASTLAKLGDLQRDTPRRALCSNSRPVSPAHEPKLKQGRSPEGRARRRTRSNLRTPHGRGGCRYGLPPGGVRAGIVPADLHRLPADVRRHLARGVRNSVRATEIVHLQGMIESSHPYAVDAAAAL